MDITPLIPADRQVIDAYGPGRFRVSNVVYETPIIVFPNRTISWTVDGFAGLLPEDFAALIAEEPALEIVLLGTGPTMQLFPSTLRRAVKERGLGGIDAMDTGAACRTYNVLLAEGRRVAAALLPA
ncbi:Mth938-like domain-containing protein [Nitrospirillum sp. BR 11752]|uniref:Mth938-like domain-containing protein n=1 Tax=Nitrospirillum sp. BR 11752 TaxID=3104293 RepID=UPI002EAD7FD8|nr:Mth938-like domain-containing protein [Nitrospirillum sp. BR 11752]